MPGASEGDGEHRQALECRGRRGPGTARRCPRKMMSPPMVGVPAFAWCSCGPSSRMCCPNSLTRRYSMNFGPRKIVISIAAMPAIRTSPRSIRSTASKLAPQASPRLPINSSVKCSRPTEREPLTRTMSPSASRPSASLDRRRRVRRPLVGRVVAGQLADSDHGPDPEAPRERADLAVIGRGVRPQLGHPAKHRDLAPAGHLRPGSRARRASRSGWRCSSRSRA